MLAGTRFLFEDTIFVVTLNVAACRMIIYTVNSMGVTISYLSLRCVDVYIYMLAVRSYQGVWPAIVDGLFCTASLLSVFPGIVFYFALCMSQCFSTCFGVW